MLEVVGVQITLFTLLIGLGLAFKFKKFKISFNVTLRLNKPVIGILPAFMDGVLAILFLCQFPFFVHIGSSHQLDTQTETLSFGQMQSL